LQEITRLKLINLFKKNIFISVKIFRSTLVDDE